MKKKKVFENEDKPVESLEKTANSWTFLTNHTHVLLCLYRYPDSTLREVVLHRCGTARASRLAA